MRALRADARQRAAVQEMPSVRVQMFWRSYHEACQIDRLQPDALAFVESLVSQNFPDI